MANEISRRSLIKGAAGAAAGAAALGASSTSFAAPAVIQNTGSNAEITLWTSFGSGVNGDAQAKLVEDFNASGQGVTVTSQAYASYEEVARAGGGIVSSVTQLRAASEDDLLEQTLPRLDALIAEGVTTVEVKSGYGLDPDNERKSLRVARRLADERKREEKRDSQPERCNSEREPLPDPGERDVGDNYAEKSCSQGKFRIELLKVQKQLRIH